MHKQVPQNKNIFCKSSIHILCFFALIHNRKKLYTRETCFVRKNNSEKKSFFTFDTREIIILKRKAHPFGYNNWKKHTTICYTVLKLLIKLCISLPCDEHPFFLASSGHVQMPVFSLYTKPAGHVIALNLPSTQ